MFQVHSEVWSRAEIPTKAAIAQLGERQTEDLEVASSINVEDWMNIPQGNCPGTRAPGWPHSHFWPPFRNLLEPNPPHLRADKILREYFQPIGGRSAHLPLGFLEEG